ncbi:hypothetical protein SELMODRAFT_427364 [Selaginella moellendorffii]|uniref:Leucine-rich repeat-containing N-terminal plant-type domain-containing protein n=1 Tax=Selaginella moellendorffii TaxID=88036 RepID=D8SZC3_SELML|nr:hypothetical protein SELMODRAFT_427364 [Selaginella moellendorffii]
MGGALVLGAYVMLCISACIQAWEMYELQALLAFKGGLSNHTALSGWTMENSHNLCVSWEGVTCSNVTGHVIMLDLRDLSLKGIISPEVSRSIGQLKNLRHFGIFDANIFGSIPEELGNCSKLEEIHIEPHNIIEGDIPSYSSNLQSLDLSDNMFGGSIPVNLGQMGGLIILDLSNNRFIGQLSNLKAHNNSLNGTLPNFLTTTSIEELYLSRNRFNGHMPPISRDVHHLNLVEKLTGEMPRTSPGFSCALRFLDVDDNSLSGKLAADVFKNMTSLEYVSLSHNKFEVPSFLSHFKSLRVLSMGENNLHGPIPDWLWNMTHLHVLDLSRNKFEGCLSCSISQLDAFKHMNFSDQEWAPLWLMVKGREQQFPYFDPSNTILDLSSNQLTGVIPSYLGELIRLRILNHSNNHFSGNIPQTLVKIVQLKQLDFSFNNIIEPIPNTFQDLHSLSSLNLSFNRLEGLCGKLFDKECPSNNYSTLLVYKHFNSNSSWWQENMSLWAFTLGFIVLLISLV